MGDFCKYYPILMKFWQNVYSREKMRFWNFGLDWMIFDHSSSTTDWNKIDFCMGDFCKYCPILMKFWQNVYSWRKIIFWNFGLDWMTPRGSSSTTVRWKIDFRMGDFCKYYPIRNLYCKFLRNWKQANKNICKLTILLCVDFCVYMCVCSAHQCCDELKKCS